MSEVAKPAGSGSRASRTRWLVLSIVVGLAALIVAVVILWPRNDTPSGGPATWDDITALIRLEGGVTAEIAVQAYSLLIEPLPGVAVGEPDLDGPLSGTPVVRWVLAHWDEITPQQRAVVERRLFNALPAPAGASVQLASYGVVEPGAAPDQGDLEDVVRRLGDLDHLGVPLRHPVLLADAEDVGRTLPAHEDHDRLTSFAYPARWNGVEWEPITYGDEDWTCVVAIQADYRVGSRSDLEYLLAHEAFHCYQFEIIGAGHDDALWVWEGSATWVGAAFTGGAPLNDERWQQYLAEDWSLFERDYDAMGFFAHLDEHADVWRNILGLVDVPSSTFEEAVALGGSHFVETWPTGLSRGRHLGEGWDTSGPGITADQRPFIDGHLGGSVTELSWTAPPGSQRLLHFSAAEGTRLVEVSVAGHGGIHLGAGRTQWTGGSHTGLYCLGDGVTGDPCICPDGGMVPGVIADVMSLPVGITGTLDEAMVSVRAVDPAEECEPSPTEETGGSCTALADAALGDSPGILAVGTFGILTFTEEDGDDIRPYPTARNCIVLHIDERTGIVRGEIIVPILYASFGSDCGSQGPVDISGPLDGTVDRETGDIVASFARPYSIDCDAFGRSVELASLRGTYNAQTRSVSGPAVAVLWETGAKGRAVTIGPFTADVVGGD